MAYPGVVIVHVQLSRERGGKCSGVKQADREVVKNVEENKQLKRLHVTNSAPAEVFTAEESGLDQDKPDASKDLGPYTQNPCAARSMSVIA